MLAALHRSGKSERPQASYVREVHLLARFFHPSPDRMTEPELQHDCLHRNNVDGLAPASMRLCSSGLRFFYPHVLQRDWPTLTLIRPQITHRLPAVLSVAELTRLLAAATPFPHQVSFTTVSRLGLRLQEALFLQGAASDGPRLQVHVHRGQGATDRYVPLPAETLTRLRTYWKTHRHPAWLLPATGRNHPQSPTAPTPMSRSSVQGAFRTATSRAGSTTLGGAIHTLRHASATHLLEAGVQPRLIQRSLGQTPLAPPRLSRHLTPQGQQEAYERRNDLMHGLLP
jgi:site-specific recombinase XerD